MFRLIKSTYACIKRSIANAIEFFDFDEIYSDINELNHGNESIGSRIINKINGYIKSIKSSFSYIIEFKYAVYIEYTFDMRGIYYISDRIFLFLKSNIASISYIKKL